MTRRTSKKTHWRGFHIRCKAIGHISKTGIERKCNRRAKHQGYCKKHFKEMEGGKIARKR